MNKAKLNEWEGAAVQGKRQINCFPVSVCPRVQNVLFCAAKVGPFLHRMYEMQVEDVAYVNWEDLTAVIG